MSEQSLVLVKPDGVCTAHVGHVIDRFERAGLRLRGIKMQRLPTERAEAFYQEHKDRPFYPGLISFMTAAPIVAMVWEGPNCIKTARTIMGSTDSKTAAAGTLRREFGSDNRYNLVHGSDSQTSAVREISFFFNTDELFAYHEQDWRTEK